MVRGFLALGYRHRTHHAPHAWNRKRNTLEQDYNRFAFKLCVPPFEGGWTPIPEEAIEIVRSRTDTLAGRQATEAHNEYRIIMTSMCLLLAHNIILLHRNINKYNFLKLIVKAIGIFFRFAHMRFRLDIDGDAGDDKSVLCSLFWKQHSNNNNKNRKEIIVRKWSTFTSIGFHFPQILNTPTHVWCRFIALCNRNVHSFMTWCLFFFSFFNFFFRIDQQRWVKWRLFSYHVGGSLWRIFV